MSLLNLAVKEAIYEDEYHRNKNFSDLQNVRGDGHPQVRVQSTKVRPRTGLKRGNRFVHVQILDSTCDV